MGVLLAQGLFGIALLMPTALVALVAATLLFLGDGVVARRSRESICLWLVQQGWRGTLLLCSPWVRIRETARTAAAVAALEAKLRAADRAGEAHKIFFVMNHASFLDVITFVAFVPWPVLRRTRVLMSAHLLRLPLLRSICRGIGHIEVHFASRAAGAFAVDKARVAATQRGIEAHLGGADLGCLAMFPEGQMNPTPAAIQPLRRGGFRLALDHGVRIYLFTARGLDACWPRGNRMGGIPANVTIDFARCGADDGGACATAAQLCAQIRAVDPSIPEDRADEAVLADFVQQQMQATYDSLGALKS
ncbi:hypothetical protein M885DRAFT_536839 [Pelagophyceae sp. CCMP2097]|nr:hypothetical protein M885DRAFT_536839 [Pelagophyceae sp. CCMP2097]